ncbi:MAG: phosphopantetheine-binding protein, partial [Gammaproteobacteria bacterium]|nr:phosphopantetheine-binding protein [Gammaproteobacteria bacterium]
PEYVEPVTDTERTIARIWSELLQVEKIGIDQNFFDIGGHSLLSISAIQKISKEFGVRISPRDMMLNTLQQIAKSLPDQLESRAETDSTKASRDSALTRLRDRLISGLGK